MFGCLAQGSPWSVASERLGAPRLRGREISRTICMAQARNQALAGFGDERLDWLVVIDADIHAKPRHIWQLIDVVQQRPRRSYGLFKLTSKQARYLRAQLLELLRQLRLDRSAQLAWNYRGSCPFERFTDRAQWMAGRPVPVQAALGGIAVLPMAIVRSHKIELGGAHEDVSIGAFALKLVWLARWWPVLRSRRWCCMTNHIPWSEEYAQRRKRELKQLWQQANWLKPSKRC